jgi:two-component system response regulator HydG
MQCGAAVQEEMAAAKGKVLVVDDEQQVCETIEECLRHSGYDVACSPNRQRALELIEERDFDAAVTDVLLGPDENGLDLCSELVAKRPDLPVVVLTGYWNLETAVGAIRSGAYDFVSKPVDFDALRAILNRAVQQRRLNRRLVRLDEGPDSTLRMSNGLLGESPAMRRLQRLLPRFGSSDASVLIRGESGTGKELVARALHAHSRNASGPFVAVNCAAVPMTLLESTLFGHVKGAFTDAKASSPGLFLCADGGTMFLDEIGDMPLDMQSKLLRALQERAIRPVGGASEVPFNARILSATHRDLEHEVREGRFRQDLYYRLNVITIEVPPLRERREDVLALAQNCLQQVVARTGRNVTGITPQAARALSDYDWPGNVRQLENVIERAVALTRFDSITVDDLPESITRPPVSQLIANAQDPERMPTAEEVEKQYVERVLNATKGNKAHAARVLGFDRRTLYRKLARWERGLSANSP